MARPKKYISEKLASELNVGAMMSQHMRKNKISKAATARVMNRTPNTLAKFLKQPSVQVAVLWEFSNAVYYNFFTDIAAKIPAHWPPHNTTLKDKDAEIASLKAEIEQLQKDKEMLLSILKK